MSNGANMSCDGHEWVMLWDESISMHVDLIYSGMLRPNLQLHILLIF